LLSSAKEATNLLAAFSESGDAIFFVCDKEDKAAKFAGRARDAICDAMDIREKGVYKLFWIVDFPMYEADEKNRQDRFLPQPVLHAARRDGGAERPDPLAVMATNMTACATAMNSALAVSVTTAPTSWKRPLPLPVIRKDVLEKKFGGMLNAFRFGAPPHGGCAFGVDRIVMLLAMNPTCARFMPSS
jgi:aspartyl-tRNA synthetase